MNTEQAFQLVMNTCAEYAITFKDRPVIHESLMLRLQHAQAVLANALQSQQNAMAPTAPTPQQAAPPILQQEMTPA